MALNARDRRAYRTDDMQDHTVMSERQRRNMIEDYLPEEPEEKQGRTITNSGLERRSHFGVRLFLRKQIHLLIYTILQTSFSLYIRIRQAWHIVSYQTASILFYHHRTPALIARDVKGLPKMPHHLSVILQAEEAGRAGADLERLINEAADISVWCACAGIPMLSVYEKTGVLKRYMPRLHQTVKQKFSAYFGPHHPALSVMAPHVDLVEESPATGEFSGSSPTQLSVLVISSEDGRDSIVDLTRTLAEMSQRGKLSPADVNMDLVDAELSEGIMQEPDLLILFGPRVELAGYPPWQIRLTEIFCLQDNYGVGYQVFLRALRNFSKAQMRRGK